MKMRIWRSPLWITLAVYWLLTFVLLGKAVVQTRGHFGYPLDDTYIHMAIGRHFAEDSVWGVTQGGFSSSTSSPLWTLLLALVYRLSGVNDWIPLALNLICGSFTIVLCYFLLRKISNTLRLTLILLFVTLFIPLPILTLTGMEHILHSLLTLWLIYCAAAFLSTTEFNSRGVILLLLLSALVTITRYEGLFLIFTVSLLLLISRRFYASCLMMGAGLLPITVYGLLSVSQGWYFFPNSILLKGAAPVFSLKGMFGFLSNLPSHLFDCPHILLLVFACLTVFLWCNERKVSGKKERYLIVIFIATTLLHMQFAHTGAFYRYEAYLILAGSVILADMVSSLISSHPVQTDKTLVASHIATVMLGFFFMLPFAWRAGKAFRDYPIAVMNIYEQQYQMGLFVKKYYMGKTVAANDIGAINYLANIKILDLWGLGNTDVVQAIRSGLYNTNTIYELVQSHNVDIVIIYSKEFEGILPLQQWIEIGRWQIPNNVICVNDTVSFYAPTALQQAEIIANLKAFSSLLPSSVRQSGIYINHQVIR